jgi:Protein of unknown function (DUF3048) N-terminal domain/Protein of unknown function (DUF3048) C-terminal domain
MGTGRHAAGEPQGPRRRLVSRHPWLTAAVTVVAAASVATTATLAFAPSGGRGPAPARAAATTAPPAPRVSLQAAPARPRGPLLDPFTGEPVKSLGPVLAVKIDNIVNARPQTGLRSADIVYVIPVEGGLTRFMAVFSSHIPPVVGPVRSARQSDLDLLRQFGRPAFAWSGATPHLVPFIERAPVADLYALQVGGYYRDPARVAPYNLFAETRQLLSEAPGASKARDIGFRFGPQPGGTRAASYSVKYPAAAYTFRWSASARRWLTWIDGAPAMATEGGQLGGSTVIVQYTQISTSRFLEYGGRPPYARSTGAGRAVILRDGRVYTVRWSRPTLEDGTTYTLLDGKRMLFAPGQVWVVLAPDSHASYVNAGKV